MRRLELDPAFRASTCVLFAALAACSGSGSGEASEMPVPIRIGAGEWMVASRDDSTAVLIRHPMQTTSPDGRATLAPADSAHTLLYHTSDGVSVADIDSLILPVSDSTGGVAPAFAIVQADALRLAVIPGRSPTLVQSPGSPEVHLFESIDGIWGIDADLLPEPITSRRVGVYDYAQLRGRQREGEIILYWATAPIWSPSGDIVAFATNREAVYEGTRGQSIWMIDMASRAEEPLVREEGRSFLPVGWLGEEVVFIGDMPGVWGADPATGQRREIAGEATFVDWARDGSAIAVAYGVPDSTRLQVIRQREGRLETVDIPGPTEGSAYLPDAVFSPDGTRLLLTAIRGGTQREHWIFDIESGSAGAVPNVGGMPTGRPAWVVDDAILVHVIIPGTGRTEAWILPFDDPERVTRLSDEARAREREEGPRRIVLPVQPGEPGENREQMQALIEGTLVLRKTCVRLQSTFGAPEYLLVWPPGFTARDLDRAILDEQGEVFARVGDRVRLGGGEVGVPAPDRSGSPDPAADSTRFPWAGECEGPYWIVGEALTPPSSGTA